MSSTTSVSSIRSMKYYADSSSRRQNQILADVLVLIWVALCIWAGWNVYNGIQQVRPAATELSSAGDSIRINMSSAASGVGSIPFGVGDALRGPFDAISGAGQTLADAGTSLGMTIDEFSRMAGLFVALVPIILVAGPWALIRYRFVRRATNAQEWLTRAGSLEMFALRALVTLPLDRLEQLGPDAVSGFFRGDQATVRALAALELEAYGVSPGDADETPAIAPGSNAAGPDTPGPDAPGPNTTGPNTPAT
jgi:hypothetical protein